MKERIIGINLPGGTKLSELEKSLNEIKSNGFSAVEINLSSMPLIIGGKVQELVAEYIKGIMDQFSFIYTAHTGYGLNLRALEDQELQRAVMFASIDACSLLGINTLNFHYEEKSMFSDREAAFRKNMQDAGDYGAERKVKINIENIEVELTEPVLDFIKAINHPNIGMTLDLGHLYLSACYYGYDYLDTVRACAPYIRHLHINDNIGIFEEMRVHNLELYNTLDKGYRFAFGRGDIHIPPLWGKAPLLEAFRIIKENHYDGIWLCEYYSHLFQPFNKEIRQRVEKEIENA